MANIFKLTKDYVNPPKRNSYDLSYQNDFTAKFGTLYPIFIKEVNPGDSFSISTSLGIRAEPMVFPVQSKIRADVHYFYVRNRTLWENWMNFIGKVDDTIEHPYIEQPVSFFKTKTLSDFLGVPTSIVGDNYLSSYFSVNPFNVLNSQIESRNSTVSTLTSIATVPPISVTDRTPKVSSIFSNNSSLPLFLKSSIGVYESFLSFVSSTASSGYTRLCYPLSPISYSDFPIDEYFRSERLISFNFPHFVGVTSEVSSIFEQECFDVFFLLMKSSQNNLSFYDREIINSSITLHPTPSVVSSSFSYVTPIQESNESVTVSGYLSFSDSSAVDFSNIFLARGYDLIMPLLVLKNDIPGFMSFATGSSNIGYDYFLSPIFTPNIEDSSNSVTLPWCGPAKSVKLSALPFRAYEAIYNSYYRNYMNNPFMLNGKPQYNRYVTNLGDGADLTPYKLFNRNWELDFLTSAQQSPQQGEAPLVGVTVNPNSTATMKFKSSELESAGIANGEVTATVEIDENTNILGISYYDEQLPQSNLKRLMEAINYGISINDLRQTTALQRWLEKNIMKGYRYIDQVKAHFGVDVSFRDLLMPEFIGGHSQNINTLTISQTTPTGDSPLGSYGGQAISNSSSENTVTKYCDEAGFIVGILSIVPTPVYSQVPQQFFYKSNVLDYYFPEFGSIGMQPIFNRDITPLQTPNGKLDDVFGYQRPWWHLISSIDEVHGEFRTNRQGYLIQRVFSETPILNGDFLSINNNAINNVFYVDDELSDQFLCQAYFKVTKKTAIPLFGVPAIENADVN